MKKNNILLKVLVMAVALTAVGCATNKPASNKTSTSTEAPAAGTAAAFKYEAQLNEAIAAKNADLSAKIIDEKTLIQSDWDAYVEAVKAQFKQNLLTAKVKDKDIDGVLADPAVQAKLDLKKAEFKVVDSAEVMLDEAIAARGAEDMAKFKRGSGTVDAAAAVPYVPADTNLKSTVVPLVASAYDNLVKSKGDNARLFRVIEVAPVKNIYGQKLDNVRIVRVELNGIEGYQSGEDAVFFVGSESPVFFRLKADDCVLLPIKRGDLEIRDGERDSNSGEFTQFGGDAPSSNLEVGLVSNVKFKDGNTSFADYGALADAGLKATVVFRYSDMPAGVMQSHPSAFKTGAASLDRNSILADLRIGGCNASGNSCVFDLAFNDEWFNYINLGSILAVNGVPVEYMQPTEAEIKARSRYRQQIVSNESNIVDYYRQNAGR